MVKNQALVGESGNRKLPDCQGETGQLNDKRSYKKRIAVMSVSIPVVIMSLKERKVRLRDMRYGLPLPRPKPSSMYMQRAKANKTTDYLSYNLHEYSPTANRCVHEPGPLMRTTGR
jgi:hypothetical protein